MDSRTAECGDAVHVRSCVLEDYARSRPSSASVSPPKRRFTGRPQNQRGAADSGSSEDDDGDGWVLDGWREETLPLDSPARQSKAMWPVPCVDPPTKVVARTVSADAVRPRRVKSKSAVVGAKPRKLTAQAFTLHTANRARRPQPITDVGAESDEETSSGMPHYRPLALDQLKALPLEITGRPATPRSVSSSGAFPSAEAIPGSSAVGSSANANPGGSSGGWRALASPRSFQSPRGTQLESSELSQLRIGSETLVQSARREGGTPRRPSDISSVTSANEVSSYLPSAAATPDPIMLRPGTAGGLARGISRPGTAQQHFRFVMGAAEEGGAETSRSCHSHRARGEQHRPCSAHDRRAQAWDGAHSAASSSHSSPSSSRGSSPERHDPGGGGGRRGGGAHTGRREGSTSSTGSTGRTSVQPGSNRSSRGVSTSGAAVMAPLETVDNDSRDQPLESAAAATADEGPSVDTAAAAAAPQAAAAVAAPGSPRTPKTPRDVVAGELLPQPSTSGGGPPASPRSSAAAALIHRSGRFMPSSSLWMPQSPLQNLLQDMVAKIERQQEQLRTPPGSKPLAATAAKTQATLIKDLRSSANGGSTSGSSTYGRAAVSAFGASTVSAPAVPLGGRVTPTGAPGGPGGMQAGVATRGAVEAGSLTAKVSMNSSSISGIVNSSFNSTFSLRNALGQGVVGTSGGGAPESSPAGNPYVKDYQSATSLLLRTVSSRSTSVSTTSTTFTPSRPMSANRQRPGSSERRQSFPGGLAPSAAPPAPPQLLPAAVRPKRRTVDDYISKLLQSQDGAQPTLRTGDNVTTGRSSVMLTAQQQPARRPNPLLRVPPPQI